MTGKVPPRISEQIAGMVEKAIARHAGGDQVSYDVVPTMAPQGFLAAVIFVMPGALLGSVVTTGTAFTNPWGAQPDQVDEVVRQAVEELRRQRTAQLAPQNGHTTPAQGLIQP